MGARIVMNEIVFVVRRSEDPLAELVVVGLLPALDSRLSLLVDGGSLGRLLARHGGRCEVRGGMLVVLGRRPELVGGRGRGLVLVLLLSIGDGEPREQDQSKCEQVLALGSDMARRPSQHLGANNVGWDVWGS